MNLSDKVPILLVDDRRENLIALQAMLDDPDYEIVTAISGHEALKKLLRRDFALVLLDVMMPDLDGYEVASLMKEREKTRHVPIIFLTAVATEVANIYRGYSVGAVDYIQKPLEPSVVKSKVAVFVDLYCKNLEIRAQAEQLRKRQLAELKRHSEVRYQALVESITHGIVWSADADLRLTFISPRVEPILGYRVNEARSRPEFWKEVIHPDDRELVLARFQQSANTAKDFDLEFRALRRDKKTIWFQTGVKVARSEEPGHPLEFRVLSVDITDLKIVEQELRAAVHARSEFMSIASHELKTPLTSLKLQVQLLKRIRSKGGDHVSSAQMDRLVDVLDRQTWKLARLVDELLDISRLESGQLELHLEQVNLAELVTEILENLQGDLKQSQTEVQIEQKDVTGGQAIVGYWDRLRMEQILTNLLSNAIKYAGGKPVVVSFGRDDSEAWFEVKDLGQGIAKEDQGRIFERFERAGSKVPVGGLGLGLYITRQLVELHGGKISVESEPGRGSCFTVRIPQSSEKLKAEQKAAG